MTEQNIVTNSDAGVEINPALYGLKIQKFPESKSGKPSGGEAQNYRVFYDENTGNCKVLPVDTNGQILEGGKSIYTNGVFDLSQMQTVIGNDSRGRDQFGSFLNEEERNDLHKTIQEGVIKTIEATGGEKPEWVMQTGPANAELKISEERERELLSGQLNDSQSATQSQMWSNTENNNNSKTNKGELFDGKPLSGYGNLGNVDGSSLAGDFGRAHTLADYDQDGDMMFKKIVRYPIDMADNMDHMMIQCYSYQPPYAPAFSKNFATKIKTNDGKKKAQTTSPGFGIPRQTPFRKKLGAGIKLPMPNNMMDQNPRNWDERAMNTGAMSAVQSASKRAVESFFTFDFLNFGGFFRRNSIAMERLKREAGRADILASQVSQLVGNMGYDIPPEQILSRSVGVIANSNTELLFSGVSLRTFEFQWQMSPRDEVEAANVKMIIRAFKQWSAPRKLKKIDTAGTGIGNAGGPSFFLGTPNIFRLRYLTKDKMDIAGVNKFKPCALTNVSVNYTPDGQWMAYDNGMPISVVMTLSFNELEPIYNTDYSASVENGRQFIPDGEGNRGDLFPISIIKQNQPQNAEIGY